MNVRQYVLVKVQLVIWFQSSLSHIHLQPAPGCALQIAFKKLFDKREEGLLTSHLNKFGISPTCLLRDCLNIPRLPEYSWLIESTVNGKVTSNVTIIF